MKYLLLEPNTTSIAYNIALMKWARWCEENGHEYQYVRGFVEPDIIPDKILMSCIFTYYSKKYENLIDFYLKRFPNATILVGGVFPSLLPEWFNKKKWNSVFLQKVQIHQGMHPEIENLIPKWNVEVKDEDFFKSDKMKEKATKKKKKIVMYSSRGCVNKCGYCAVPKLEGDMRSFKTIKQYLETGKRELPEATSIVLYDNNFTAHHYIHDIIDELVEFGMPVDIHGLHVDGFTWDIAKYMSKLKFASQNEGSTAYIRFSFDKMKYRDNILTALEYAKEAGIKAEFFCYMLFNWIDRPFDFWKRIVLSQEMVDTVGKTICLFPQRYEPFGALEKYQYIGKHWTNELARGARRISTFLHGFLPVTTTHNIFNWLGHDFEEFISRLNHMGESPKNRLEKKNESPPSLEKLLDTIK